MSKQKIIEETLKYLHATDRKRIEVYDLFMQTLNEYHLQYILRDKRISPYNRFIYFSRIAKYLPYTFTELSVLAASLPIVYDTRTGIKPGCIYYPSYTQQETDYNTEVCAYYDKKIEDWKYCDKPALDCSGFVSFMLYITEKTDYPINEYKKGKMRKGAKRSKGNWNIFYSNLIKPVDEPLIGDLVFFPKHIGIVTKTKWTENGIIIKEFVHSNAFHKGVTINNDIDMKWLLDMSVQAIEMQEEVTKDNKYLLGRLV